MTKRPAAPRRPAATAKRSSGRGTAAADPPRGRGVRSVAEMLPEIGGVAFRRFGFVQSSVVSRWAEIVGDRYATVSAPEMIRFPAGKRSGGTLVLSVEGAHAPMMQHVAPVILDRVNRFFGYPAVAKLAIQQGAAAARRAPRPAAVPGGRPFDAAFAAPTPPAAPPSLRPLPADLGDSLRAIVDPELRDCLAALAAAVAASDGPPTIGLPPDHRSRSRD